MIIIDKNKLYQIRNYVHKITATELSQLVTPCYYPTIKKYHYELLNRSGLSEKEVIFECKQFWRGTKFAKFKIENDPISFFLVSLLNQFLSENDKSAFKSLLIYFGIRYYTNLMHKQIKYCNESVFRWTLDNLPRIHLFSREKGISGFIIFMTKEMERRHIKSIKEFTPSSISSFLREYRHRISQSIKSFAAVYYKASEEGLGMREPATDEEGKQYEYETLEKTQRLIGDIVKKIVVYRHIDTKALHDAKNLTKIKSSLATIISKDLTNTKYSNELSTIYSLFLKGVTNINTLCKIEYFQYVRTLMAIKRTSKKIYFKQQINELLLKILKSSGNLEFYEKFTNQTKFNVNMFLAYYITMILRNTICQ